MKLIIGLGNPGIRYRQTRHNIGSLVVEELAKKFAIGFKKRFWQRAKQASIRIDNEPVRLIIPLTYMNLSGRCVASITRKEKINPPLHSQIKKTY